MGIKVTTAEHVKAPFDSGDFDRSGDYNKKPFSEKIRPIKAIQLEK